MCASRICTGACSGACIHDIGISCLRIQWQHRRILRYWMGQGCAASRAHTMLQLDAIAGCSVLQSDIMSYQSWYSSAICGIGYRMQSMLRDRRTSQLSASARWLMWQSTGYHFCSSGSIRSGRYRICEGMLALIVAESSCYLWLTQHWYSWIEKPQ